MDPDAPERSKGIKRAAGGIVYAPAKGILYGGKSVLGGVIMGSAAVVVGAGAMIANVASGFKEMGEAGVNAARRKRNSQRNSEETTRNTEEVEEEEKPHPSFIGGLKKATIGAVAAPFAVSLFS
jgi:hypothetical protein